MKEIFPRGDAIRLDIVKMFNKRYINEEEHYTMVKGQIFDFGIEAINELFGLEANEIGHAIFKNLQERDLEDILKRIAWPETRWDILPTRVSLFPHNLNTEANIWLVFVKKKMMPTLHDNTISIERMVLVYDIMEHLLVNIGEKISEHIKLGLGTLVGQDPSCT
ncbi:hypothetical protein E5676_scaffold118G00350 [Cucumis melo var. makuwa]|uniref:Putative plant transposon protein domain-containing protein n=1 Tax=Cucumis melo var. makuwa TaxID=1194695 RepID=A0A5A7U670_CUCMM|nr:hypothetical protein E6C27_scaffold1591G00330 [Cucumis melo var. makuwa]TYK08684.1 hypothetical protein E5676_scaffold118G00350 [Cucumis melo var. makuwa]